MNSSLGQKLLVVYLGILTVAFSAVVLCGFSSSKGEATFDELNVHRINVIEPDGTIRMVIANQDRFPGSIVKGKEYPHPERRAAGMLFYNNEGTETGGLIYGSFLNKNGTVNESNVHLSFDQYMQDQIFSIDAGQSNGRKFSRLRINDVGDYSILDAIKANERISKLPKSEHDEEWKKFFATHPGNHPRIVLGRDEDRSTILQLKDQEGRNRIVMKVAPDGTPVIQLLDGTGHVSKEIRGVS